MKEHISKKEIIEKITPVIENTAMRYNLIPLEIDLIKENNHWFLRIFIYSTEHGISHDDCKNISRGLGDFLDELIPFKYYLEISSPGLNRKLKSDREFQLFKGFDVIVKTKECIEGLDGKTQSAVLLDYIEGKGIKILLKENNKEIILSKEEFFSIRLDEDESLNKYKGEDND